MPVVRTRKPAPVLDVEDLVVTYGAVKAVDGVSVSVPGGRVLGILGSNGAGKSSLLRTVGGVVPPTSGHISISGHNLSDPREATRARGLVGYCPDVGGLIRQATVREHVATALAFSPINKAERKSEWARAMNLVEEFDLLRVFDRVTEGFSHGMSRRVSVMLAVLTARDLLILDEPFDGVDPLGVNVTLDAITQCVEKGIAVLVSTHLRELLVRACNDIVVMNEGRVVASGASSEFIGDAGQIRYEQILRPERLKKDLVA